MSNLLLECDHSVLFLASKLYLFGKRLNTKQNLQTTLAADDKVQFDAVPCEPSENYSSCPWFATLVWKGKKPCIDYDAPATFVMEPRNSMAEMKLQKCVAEIKHVSTYNFSQNKLVHDKNFNTANNEVWHGENAMLAQ
jgi:hypothetical protein